MTANKSRPVISVFLCIQCVNTACLSAVQKNTVSRTVQGMSVYNGAVHVTECSNNFLNSVGISTQCLIRIPRPLKYKHVEVKRVNCVTLRSSLHISNGFLLY